MPDQETQPEISWRYCARIEPGKYPGYARLAKTYRDGQFKRWVCAVQFDILELSLTELLSRLSPDELASVAVVLNEK